MSQILAGNNWLNWQNPTQSCKNLEKKFKVYVKFVQKLQKRNIHICVYAEN